MKPTLRSAFAFLGVTLIFFAFNVTMDLWQMGLGVAGSVCLSIAWISGDPTWFTDGPIEEEDEL